MQARKPGKNKANGKPAIEPPPHDLDAERAVLGAVLGVCELAPILRDSIRPEQFFIDAHQWICRAILEARAPDVVTVKNWLHEIRRLEQIGGAKYLAQLLNSEATGTVESVVAYCKIIRHKWQLRVAKGEALALVAKAQTGSIGDISQAFRESAEQIERLTTAPDESIFGIWGTDESIGNLFDEPEHENWLLRDAISDTNDPAIPLGRAGFMGAGGGVGKTTALVQLGVLTAALAAGVAVADPSWCGFRVENAGAVYLCCAESDLKLMRRHLWRAFNYYDLDAEQRADTLHNMLVLPLAGKHVRLIDANGQRTDFCHRLHDRLNDLAAQTKVQWSLGLFDCLSRFGGPDTETDSASATEFVEVLESFCELPGTPTNWCTSHSSKISLADGDSNIRGVTAITDAGRFSVTMARHVANGVVGALMVCRKSNEAMHFGSRWLIQQRGDRGGTFRLASDGESAMLTESLQKKRSKPKSQASEPPQTSVRDALLATLKKADGFARSRRWLVDNTPGRATELYAEIKSLILEGLAGCDEFGKTKGAIRLVGSSAQLELTASQNSGSKVGKQ